MSSDLTRRHAHSLFVSLYLLLVFLLSERVGGAMTSTYVASPVLRPMAKACRDGSGDDCLTLALYLLGGTSHQVEAHHQGALDALERACDANSRLGCRVLGDLSPSFRWWAYERACNAGDAEACLKYATKPGLQLPGPQPTPTESALQAAARVAAPAEAHHQHLTQQQQQQQPQQPQQTTSQQQAPLAAIPAVPPTAMMQRFVARRGAPLFESPFYTIQTLMPLSSSVPSPVHPLVATSMGNLSASCFEHTASDADDLPPLHLSRSLQRANDCSVLFSLPTVNPRYRTLAYHNATTILQRLCTQRCSTPLEQQEDPNIMPVCTLLGRNLLAFERQQQQQQQQKDEQHAHEELAAPAAREAFQRGCQAGEYAACTELAFLTIGPHDLPVLESRSKDSAYGNPQLYATQLPVPEFAKVASAIDSLTAACQLDPRGCVMLARAYDFLAQNPTESTEEQLRHVQLAKTAFARACTKASDRPSCARLSVLDKVKTT